MVESFGDYCASSFSYLPLTVRGYSRGFGNATWH
jgi:hypothetical protein